jgi:dolichol-phosphate mannosyltransferase
MFREEATIETFHGRLVAALDSISPPIAYEAIYVDDGSDDSTVELIKAICESDPRVKLVALSRNFGHQLAITSGLDHASGDAAITIDTDLQDPPEVIPAMVEQWRAGFEVVDGERSARAGESRTLMFAVRQFYGLLERLSDTPLPSQVADFRLIDRDVLDVFNSMREENRYVRGMIPWVGFKRTTVQYERDRRYAGDSNYRLGRRIRLAFDAITSFSERPLQIASTIGLFVTLFALILAGWIVIRTLTIPDAGLTGYASIIVSVLFVGGIQLLGLGLIGSYMGRIYREVKARPLYVVRSRVNLDVDSRSEVQDRTFQK